MVTCERPAVEVPVIVILETAPCSEANSPNYGGKFQPVGRAGLEARQMLSDIVKERVSDTKRLCAKQ